MARESLEKETDVFNQMNQTMALNNQIMKDQVASLKSKKKVAPAKAVVKNKPVDPKFGKFVTKKAAGPMPKVAQKKAPAVPGGSSPSKGVAAPGGSSAYKGNPAPGGSTRAVAKPSASAPASKSAAKPAVKKPDPNSFASSNLAQTFKSLSGSLGNGKKSGNYPAMQNNRSFASQVKPAAPTANKKPDPNSFASSNLGSMFKSLGNALNSVNGRGAPAPQPTVRSTAGIAGKSGKSVNQLFK